jgi:calcineurin-like phosphoesterase family protein
MTIFFTSDLHAGHKNIIKYCNRPFADTDEMNHEIIRRWNAVVTDDDRIWVLGDVALGPIHESLEAIGQLNGRKYMVVGNHDRNFRGGQRSGGMEPGEWDNIYRKYFVSIWQNVPWAMEYMNGNRPLAMSHFPYDGDHTDKARYMEYRLPDRGVLLIHGHTHSTDKFTRSEKGSPQVHVGMDAWNYVPVSTRQIEMLLKDKETRA